MSGPQNDFAGRNGQVWFVGVVEDRKDPAKAGRIRARIIGWHDENLNITPTEDLPWAQVSVPVNSSRHSSLPREGDWVHGFFLDGYAGQQPLILGVIPGIVSNTPRTPTGANDVLSVLEAQLVSEQAKLDGMLAGQVDATLKQKIAAQQKVIDDLQKKYDESEAKAAALLTRAQAQLLPSIYDLYRAEVLNSNALLTQLNAAKAQLNNLSQTSPAGIEKQRKKVETIKQDIATIKEQLNKKPQTGFRDTASNAQVETRPRPIDGVVTDRKNETTLPLHAIGSIAKTGIDLMNKNRSHVCDTALYIRAQMAAARMATGQIAQAIREAIKTAMEALGITPALSAIAEKLKSFAKKLKRITALINEVNDYVAMYTKYIAEIKAVIEYIQSLPAQIAYLFKKCVTEAYAELAKALRLFAGQFNIDNPLGEVVGASMEALQALNETAKAAQTLYEAPNRIISALQNPSGMSLEEREKIIMSLFPGNEKHDEKTYSGATM